MIDSERIDEDPDPRMATLRDCYLVASSFLGPARRALYGEITASVAVRDERRRWEAWKMLFDTVVEYPSLVALVRSIRISVKSHINTHFPRFNAGFGVTGDASASRFARALQACRNAVDVRLRWHMPSQWDLEAGPVFRVLASAAAPTLRSLSLNVIAGASVGAYSEYLSILQAQPHLKSFTVRGLVPTCDGDDPLAFALESLHLWEVDEDQGDHVFSPFFKLVSGSSHASLQSLSLPYLDHGFEMPILTPFSRLTYLSLLDLPLDPTSFICQVPFLPIRELYIKAQDGPLSFLPSRPTAHPRGRRSPGHSPPNRRPSLPRVGPMPSSTRL